MKIGVHDRMPLTLHEEVATGTIGEEKKEKYTISRALPSQVLYFRFDKITFSVTLQDIMQLVMEKKDDVEADIKNS